MLLVVSVILRQAPPSGGPATPCFHSADLSRERVSFQSTPAGDLGLRSQCGFRPLSFCEPTVAGGSPLCSPTLVTHLPTVPRDEIGPPKVTGAGGWGGMVPQMKCGVTQAKFRPGAELGAAPGGTPRRCSKWGKGTQPGAVTKSQEGATTTSLF